MTSVKLGFRMGRLAAKWTTSSEPRSVVAGHDSTTGNAPTALSNGVVTVISRAIIIAVVIRGVASSWDGDIRVFFLVVGYPILSLQSIAGILNSTIRCYLSFVRYGRCVRVSE